MPTLNIRLILHAILEECVAFHVGVRCVDGGFAAFVFEVRGAIGGVGITAANGP